MKPLTLTRLEELDWYGNGLELAREGTEGWSVHTGCEGEVATFIGFFARKEDAEALLTLRDPDDATEERYRDWDVSPAILTEHGVVTANDFEVTTHAQLRESLARATAKWLEQGAKR